MFEDNRKDIYEGIKSFMPISLFGEMINVGVIGGGRAASIKVKYFLNRNSNVEVLAKEICEEIQGLQNEKLVIKVGSYTKEFIKDKHIIVIAINDSKVIEDIKRDCLSLCKIFISSYSFKDGMGVIPVARESENMIFSINSKCGNPKGTLMVAEKVEEIINEYDEFIKYTSVLRENIKLLQDEKDEILSFILSEDYKIFYGKEKDRLVLRLFYDADIVKKVFAINNEV